MVAGYRAIPLNESEEKSLYSLVIVNILFVFLWEVIFSTIWKVLPGMFNEILKKVEPKSKPITPLALAVVSRELNVITQANKDNILPFDILSLK